MFLNVAPAKRLILELEARYEAIGKEIYVPLALLEVTAWVTPEPVPFALREQGRRLALHPGETWGNLWDCAWFHLTGQVPSEAAGQRVVMRFDFSGEGCVVDAQGSPVSGLTTASSEFDPTQGRAGKTVFPLIASARGGEEVDVWVEAGCNDLFGNYRNSGTLQEASIAIEREGIKALFHDFAVLLDLASTLPARSARRHRILAALRRAARETSPLDQQAELQARSFWPPSWPRPAEMPHCS